MNVSLISKCHSTDSLEDSWPKLASLSIAMSQYLITRKLLFAFSLSPAAQLGLNGFVTSAKHVMAWLSAPEHVQATDLAEDVKSSFSLMGECFHCLIGSVAQVQIIVGGLQLQKPHLGKLWGSCGRMLHCTPIRKGNVKHMRCEKWAITRLRSRRKIVPKALPQTLHDVDLFSFWRASKRCFWDHALTYCLSIDFRQSVVPEGTGTAGQTQMLYWNMIF